MVSFFSNETKVRIWKYWMKNFSKDNISPLTTKKYKGGANPNVYCLAELVSKYACMDSNFWPNGILPTSRGQKRKSWVALSPQTRATLIFSCLLCTSCKFCDFLKIYDQIFIFFLFLKVGRNLWLIHAITLRSCFPFKYIKVCLSPQWRLNRHSRKWRFWAKIFNFKILALVERSDLHRCVCLIEYSQNVIPAHLDHA